jgi:hypothetical protein
VDQRGQLGRTWGDPCFTACALLELPTVTVGAVIRPVLAGMRLGAVEMELSPTVVG